MEKNKLALFMLHNAHPVNKFCARYFLMLLLRMLQIIIVKLISIEIKIPFG